MEMPIDMQHQAMGYDRTSTMFSPDGHLLQVEYAEKTVRLGSSSIGMKCSDGVFILSDRRSEDKLVVKRSTSKVHEIDSHLIASVSGIVSDARILIEKAQVLAQQNRMTYDTPIGTELLIKEIANLQQQFTQYGGARPYGVSMMVAGVTDESPELYTSDVTGNYFEYYANAIGEKDDKIKEILREKYKEDLTIKKGVKLALDILKEVFQEKFKIERFELMYIEKDDPEIKKVEGEKIPKI
jgi:proteasome alpha subunit